MNLVNPAGLEPATVCLEGRCSIQLSYESKLIWCEEKKLSGRQDSNLRPSGPKPDALPPAPLPEHYNKLLFAERLGLEPRGRFRDHSLAGCCITTLPPFRWGAQI